MTPWLYQAVSRIQGPTSHVLANCSVNYIFLRQKYFLSFFTGASHAILLLLGTDLYRYVSSQQQLAISTLSSKSATGLLRERAPSDSKHR